VDQYRMNSHKLMYHPKRVGKWLDGENVYPIYLEVSPSGTCNLRCIFCAIDYLGYRPNFLDKGLFLKNAVIMAEKGVKSINFSGDGEPLLNPDTPEMAVAVKKLDIDVAMTTNGVLFTPSVAETCLAAFSWLRFSCNAGSDTTYKTIHRTEQSFFDKVIANIGAAVEIKRKHKLATTIGVQMLLLPENAHEVLVLAEKLAELGVDYFSVKPYSQHPRSISRMSKPLDYTEVLGLEQELQEKYGKRLSVIFRSTAMLNKATAKRYPTCYGLPFYSYIDACARIWACNTYLGDDRFCYGDLHEMDFDVLWEGEKRKQILDYVHNQMDIGICREICRLDEINNYLFELQNPGPHVNFI
jgi:GTP 3',8-cyclase